MKGSIMIFMLFVGFMVIGSFGGIYFNYIGSKQVLTEHISSHLESVAKSRAHHIETFMEMMKVRIIDFSSDGKIKDCLYSLTNNLTGCTHEELNTHLTINKLSVDENLYEVFILDANGKVAATTNLEEEIGADFSKDLIFLRGKEESYVKDISFDDEFNQIGMAVSTPIIRENKFIGVVVNRIKPANLYEILLDRIGLGETGEIYLINNESYMITPSRFLPEEYTFLKLEVDTANSRDCFEDYRTYLVGEKIIEHEEEPPVFEDYRGVKVLGTHAYVPEMNWCLLAEIDETEALGNLRNKLLKTAFMVLIGITVIIAVFIFLSGYLIEKIVKEARKGNRR